MNSVAGRRITTVDLLADPPRNLELRSDSLVAEVVLEGRRRCRRTTRRRIEHHGRHGGARCGCLRQPVPADAFGPRTRGEPHRARHPRRGGPGRGGREPQRPCRGLPRHRLPGGAASRTGPAHDREPRLASSGRSGSGPRPVEQRPGGRPCRRLAGRAALASPGRGRVRLASPDPTTPPGIRLPTPTDEDVAALSYGVRRALDVMATPALQTICSGPPTSVPDDEELLGAWIRDNVYSLPHTVGTCAMGASPGRWCRRRRDRSGARRGRVVRRRRVRPARPAERIPAPGHARCSRTGSPTGSWRRPD